MFSTVTLPRLETALQESVFNRAAELSGVRERIGAALGIQKAGAR